MITLLLLLLLLLYFLFILLLLWLLLLLLRFDRVCDAYALHVQMTLRRLAGVGHQHNTPYIRINDAIVKMYANAIGCMFIRPTFRICYGCLYGVRRMYLDDNMHFGYADLEFDNRFHFEEVSICSMWMILFDGDSMYVAHTYCAYFIQNYCCGRMIYGGELMW